MSIIRKAAAIILAAMLLTGILPALADGEAVVKNFKQLIEAMNDKQADRILISAKYKHGSKETENLKLEGRTVIIASETGEEVIIDGRIDIYGPGTVIFENVSIKAPQEAIGLWVGHDATVTIDSVSGGEGKKSSGGTAVLVEEAELKIGSAIGGKSAAGAGGDGIIAYGNSRVEAGRAVGGSCTDGVGGAGAVAMSGARVTISEAAVGGDGAVNPGKAILIGADSSVEVSGEQKDGEQLESKKAPDPDKITNYALLENALRNGKTDIQLDPAYKSGMKPYDDLPMFTTAEQTIRISGNGKNGKPQKIGEGFCMSGGSWEISGIDIAAKVNALYVRDKAQVLFSGNCSSNKNVTVLVRGQSKLDLTGNIEYSGNIDSTLCVFDDSVVNVTGNISTKQKESNALYLSDGTVTIRGNVSAADYPAIFAIDGTVDMEGNITSKGASVMTSRAGKAKVLIKGNIINKSKRHWAIYSESGEITVEGNVDSPYPASGTDGKIIINGEVKYPE